MAFFNNYSTSSDLISLNFTNEKQTFLISLEIPNLTTAEVDLERISYGGDVWELRIDLLECHVGSLIPSKDFVASQVTFLQQRSSLPIIFTIRTVSQGGKFPDDATREALDLMLLAVEKGCEYIEVEFSWPDFIKDEMCKRKKASKIIVSFHDQTGKMKWSDPRLEDYINSDGFGDILKLSLWTTNISDCHELAVFVRHYRTKTSKAIIAIGIGQNEQLSLVTNPIQMVTHPLIPPPYAAGQTSLAEVHRALNLNGQLPARQFYIFGHNISHSLSPTIHNAAFAELGLPYHYSIHQTAQIDESVREILHQPQFGGASVTFPHKLTIRSMLDSVSESAQKCGAVNTVIVQESPAGRQLKGDNTDWLGISKCIQRSRLKSYQTGIVIGAGGAARAAVFAFQQLGISRITLINRTRKSAERLATEFPSLQIEIYSSLLDAPAADVIVGCIPADDVREEDIPGHIFANTGMVVEMSYRPPVSALMRAASQRSGWEVCDGVDVLKEQAYCQFELWTGRRAPVLVIEEALENKKARKI